MLGDREAALALAEEDLALARVFDTPRAIGVALRAAGLAAGRPARGGAACGRRWTSWRCATPRSSTSAPRPTSALTCAAPTAAPRRASTCAPRSTRHTTRAPGPSRREPETELRATGARPRRVVLSGLDSLTSSERRVAELARDGMTNREIAQSLFVTARTVEGHLTQVFRKLDVSARRDLAEALAPGRP